MVLSLAEVVISTTVQSAGGALETVIDGSTGIFFDTQSEDSLLDAVERFHLMIFDRKIIQNHAKNFSEEVFKEKIKSVIQSL